MPPIAEKTHSKRSRYAAGVVLALVLLAAVASAAGLDSSGASTAAKRADVAPPRAAALPAAKPSKSSKSSKGRPNILVIESDDQTVDAQKVMSTVNRRIGARGATFRDSFASNPLCCPSRATFLTGQYSRNNGVLDNSKPNGGYTALDHTNTLPVWLQDSGYYTALIGKYLNGYERQPQPQTIPPGWTNWQGTTNTYRYYDYQLNENGSLVNYGIDPADYQTDVFTQKAVDLINQRAGRRKPWFTWLTYLAPHGGGPNPSPNPPSTCTSTAKPAPRDAGALDDEPLPITPSFNEGDVSDKPSFIADQTYFDQDTIDKVKRFYHCRLGSLLALDDGVDKIMDTLRATDQMQNTYVIYTSDNGWFDGQHRIANGKRRLYEPSIRVPLMIRGPGIEHGVKVKDLAVNADLAPTITKLADADDKVRRRYDGRPLQPLIKHPDLQRGRELLLNGTRKKGVGLRTRRYYFAKFQTQEYEMYDLKRDPDELQNIYGDPAYAKVQSVLQSELSHLRHCDGSECRVDTRARLIVHRKPGKGRNCSRPPVAARVVRKGGGVDRVIFHLNHKRAGVDEDRPFETRIPPAQRKRHKVKIDARVDLLDGRRGDISKHARICR